PLLGKDADAQALRGAARLQDRAQPQQGANPRALRQPDLSRAASLWVRRRLADLLRQGARSAQSRRDRHARRPAEGAVDVQPDLESAAREAAPAVCAAADD